MDVTACSSIVMTKEVPTLKEKNLNGEQSEEKHEIQKASVLPPENDENDSRWTLKYCEPAEGLVELIEDSRVYVNANKLAECEKLSSDSNRLAQLLLTEIFTTYALSTCSWSGTKANAADKDSGDATPELDAHATNTLLTFVKEYAQRHGWELTDCHCIVKNLREIMLQKKLALPQNYDACNSRWTLKYREPAPGLVELMERSRVYVSADKLGKCLNLSNDCVTLARMLLSEIFTTTALSTCSVTDTTAKYMKQNDKDIRPVLDEHALLTLLIFVVEYGQEKNWRMVRDEQRYIQHFIRQKIEVMRRVQKKTVEEDKRDQVLRKYCSLGLTSLPPEYDANDSRWTLKHRDPAPELVELVEHSGVYVNAEKLAECKEVSKDCVTLAKNLLTEVFTTIALATCSLAIKNSECYEFYGMQRAFRPKPELDAYAEVILLNYVDEYGLQQGWPVMDFRFIQKGMTDIMRQIEQQYGLKQKELELAQDKLTVSNENSLT